MYSVGEEQGPGYAKEVVWSPLGGSRYLRCLLAVLATNHKTWIFEPVGHVGADVRPVSFFVPQIALSAHADEGSRDMRSQG